MCLSCIHKVFNPNLRKPAALTDHPPPPFQNVKAVAVQ